MSIQCCNGCGSILSPLTDGTCFVCTQRASTQSPQTMTEAIQRGFMGALGMPIDQAVQQMETVIRDFAATKVHSNDIEVERAFRLFFVRLFSK